ncbi:hypothetical protein L1049_009784 [Liquidambar formosana]|uniref:UBC core domain-containing protein n=1 Tax=Liquidambar formosana TaxID=63359 RepID=A0AAP0R3T2_LIQFO
MDLIFSDSDWESFSESNSSEDHEGIDFMYGGQAQSILSNLEESIGKIDDFLSFERGFIYGDIVCSVTDPSGQMGRVVDVDMFVNLENVFGEVIKDVSSKKLLRIRSISVGDYVVCGPWLGRVDKVVDCVTVLFDDGAKCVVPTVDQEKLFPISPSLLEDSQYPYYPGQRVQVRLSTVSKSARWLCGTWKGNRDEGTVCSVEAGLVYVDWLASALLGCDLSLPAPPRLQDSKNLTLLSCFSHANWQLGDWCILPIAERRDFRVQIIYNASTFDIIKEHKKLERGFKRRDFSSNFEEIFVIVKTKTKVDVLWQDGSISLGLDSQSLFPINIVNAHEFWPEQFVLEKGTCDDPHASSSQRWGVVRGVDAKEHTVKVKWKSVAMNQVNDVEGDWMEEIVSAYELVEHPDYSFSLGDVVFRSGQYQIVDQTDEQTYKDVVKTKGAIGEEAGLEGKNCGGDQNEYLDKVYLSCIGNVVGCKDGGVEVKWATGLTTKVDPCEIFRMDNSEGSTTTPVIHEEDVEDMSEHDNQSSHQKGKDLLDLNGVGEDCKKYPWQSSSFFLPRAAIGFFTSIATSLFGSLGSTSLTCPKSSGLISEHGTKYGVLHDKEVLEPCGSCIEGQPMIIGDLQETSNEASSKQQVKEIQEDKKNLLFSLGSKNPEHCRQFDMVGDCSDHHFVDHARKGLVSSQVKRGWLKKVQQEWSILEKNLPETVYVRIYEERMDLLRAAIVGAAGTPYHDGLFFFDIFIPPDYPHEPPHFEALVEEHFSRRSQYILLACKAYLEGAPVGCAFGHGNIEQENLKECSMGFKIMLAKLFPKLVEAFSDKGIDCSQFVEPGK